MKKYLLLTALVWVAGTAQADFWDNCTANGGTIITANSYGNDKGGYCNDPNNTELTNNCNGKRFCRSGNAMNWWSSFTWCESIGGKLASFESMCPGVQIASQWKVYGACPNLTAVGTSGRVWSSAGFGSNGTAQVDITEGFPSVGTGSGNTRDDTRFFAFCEEK